MNKLPKEIKDKIIQFNKSCLKTAKLQNELTYLFKGYNMDIEDFYGNKNYGMPGNLITKGFAYILNCEGNINEIIKEIEKLFLYYNKCNNNKIENFIINLKEKLKYKFKNLNDLKIGYEYRKDIGFYNIYHNKKELDIDKKYTDVINKEICSYFTCNDNIYFAYDFDKFGKDDNNE